MPTIHFFNQSLHAESQSPLQQYIIKNNIKMATSQLGFKVLATIQSLISQIDKPANTSSVRKAEMNEASRGATSQFDKYKVYSKMSYNFRKKQNQVQKTLLGKVYDDEQQHEKFKVTNKTTLKILQKRQIRPIHERAPEIMARKDIFIQKQRYHLQERQREAMKPSHHSTDDLTGRKYNESDLESYRYDIDTKNKERIKRRNMSKLNLVRKEEEKIPTVNSFSRSLSSKRNVQKNYSQDVFERMMQYNYEQNSNKVKLIETRRREEGNFEPVLCSKSLHIVQKLKKSRPSLERAVYHHSHCILPPPKIDKTPKKIVPKSIKKQASTEKKDVSKEKEPPKVVNQPPTRSKNKDKDKDKQQKKVPTNKTKTVTPLKQKQVNSVKNLSTQARSLTKNQKLPPQNKENQKFQRPKTKQHQQRH